MLKNIVLILLLVLSLKNFLFAKDIELEKIFENNQVNGTIVIESLNKKRLFVHNDNRADSFLSPASTFKIPNSLIALNEGVVTKDSLIVWDKKVREYESMYSEGLADRIEYMIDKNILSLSTPVLANFGSSEA